MVREREWGDGIHLVLNFQHLFVNRPAKGDTYCQGAIEHCVHWNGGPVCQVPPRAHSVEYARYDVFGLRQV